MSQITKEYIKQSLETAKKLDNEKGDFMMGVAGDFENIDMWYSGNKPMMIIGLTRLIEELAQVLGFDDATLTFGQVISLILDEHEANVLEAAECEEECEEDSEPTEPANNMRSFQA